MELIRAFSSVSCCLNSRSTPNSVASISTYSASIDGIDGQHDAHAHERLLDLHGTDASRFGETTDGAGEFQGYFSFSRCRGVGPSMDQRPAFTGGGSVLLAAVRREAVFRFPRGPASLAISSRAGHAGQAGLLTAPVSRPSARVSIPRPTLLRRPAAASPTRRLVSFLAFLSVRCSSGGRR